jgi:uncharacterized protein (TIGR03000 family)
LPNEEFITPDVPKEVRMKKFIALAAFGLVAMFVAMPERAAAQYIVRYNGWGPGIGLGWRGFGLFRRPWRVAYYYPSPAYYDWSPAYYPAEEAIGANTATIRVRVPSDARIWIEGEATSQGGNDRTFVSPSLAPGSQYVYHIRAQWNENGKAVERNREVTVHAGDRVNLNMAS